MDVPDNTDEALDPRIQVIIFDFCFYLQFINKPIL